MEENASLKDDADKGDRYVVELSDEEEEHVEMVMSGNTIQLHML